MVRNNKLIIALSLAIMGVLIYLGDKYAAKKYKKPTELEKISLKQAFLVGVSQAFAVIPGFSRSGTTILAGRLLGLSKEAIAKLYANMKSLGLDPEFYVIKKIKDSIDRYIYCFNLYGTTTRLINA